MVITSLDWLVREAKNLWELRREIAKCWVLIDRESLYH
uniref:Uncharacterized protein n=1 Tax=Arundo donax TaxID=35708 RepID=A0A0A9FCE4_ARUDO